MTPFDIEFDRQSATLDALGYPGLAPFLEPLRTALWTRMADVDTFAPVLDVPDAPVYVLVGVERGEESCGVRPADAVVTIADRGRSALTIEEGISFLHAVPEALEKNKCFHTAASRGGDRRVPALWISQKAPTLGWCWEDNLHTWLGVASTGDRVAAFPAHSPV